MILALSRIALGGLLLVVSLASLVVASPRTPPSLTIKNNNPFIYYHGRWDSDVGTWW